jgi:hypothetical protein
MPYDPPDLHHPVDLAMKLFWDTNPEPLLRRGFGLAKGAELRAEPTNLVQAARRDADRIMRVVHPPPERLLHSEFETHATAATPRRLFGYHVGAWDRAGRLIPVDSLLTLTGRPHTIPSGTLRLHNARSPVITFHYRVLPLWSMTADELAASDLAALTPLGRDLHPDALRAAIRRVEDAGEASVDLMGVLYSLARHREVPRESLHVMLNTRRLEMANWFREIARKAERDGWKKGLDEGRAEGERATAFRFVTTLIEVRVPHLHDALLPWASAASVDDLQWLAARLGSSITDDELLRAVAARPTGA